MQNQPLTLQDGTQLDPKIVKVMKTIKQLETGSSSDPYNAVGDKGAAKGAYQFNEKTGRGWKNYAKSYLGDPNAPMTPANQNKAMYSWIKEQKDKGLQPEEIDALHNGAKKDASGRYVHLNPTRAQNFRATIAETQQIQQQEQIMPTSETSIAPTIEQPKKEGFLKTVAKGIISPVATMLARPVQLGAEYFGGASAEDVNKATKDIAGDWVAPVPQTAQDVAKDVGRAAETVALGLPVKGIGAATKVGALAGAGSGLEQEGTLGGAAKGALIGGGLGLAGGIVSKGFESLPTRFTKDAFGLSDEQAQKMLAQKTIGTKSSLLKQSETATGQLKNTINQYISAAEKAGKRGSGNDALRKTLLDYPEFNSDKGIEKMLTKVKSLLSSNAGVSGYVGRGKIVSALDKIANGTATLAEKDMVRSAIDSATTGGYSKLARSINPSAGHDLAMTFANNLRNEVKAWVPETQPIFDELSKEMGIKHALVQLTNKKGEALIGYNDILPYLMGQAGGPVSGVATAAGFKAARSPATKFAVAKTIQGVGKAVTPATSRAGLIGGIFGPK